MNIKTELKLNNTFAKKSLGQNFLNDKEVLDHIVEFAEVKDSDNIIEIGPGLGALTSKLIDAGAKITSIEIDKKLVPVLSQKFGLCDNFNLIEGDFLELTKPDKKTGELPESFINTIDINKKYKCVANIPYYITSPIIMRLLSLNFISDITIMIQKEVADRIFAEPSTKDYGILTLAVKYFACAIDSFQVSRSSFTPMPNVDSTVVKLIKHNDYKDKVKDESFLFSVIKGSFSQRRKKLANSLSSTSGIDKNLIINALSKIGFTENARAEELSLDNFIELSKNLA